jgi:thioredoxin reductase (NADPH)
MDWDLIVVGGGPAGLSAGLYGVRAELETLVLESRQPGGQIATAGIVENYPGFPEGIMGIKLAENFRLQAEKAGAQILPMQEVESVEIERNRFLVRSNSNSYFARAVIIATGLRHRKLGVQGEKEFTGRGVSYCFTCDGPFFRDKNVVVVGSGTSAVEAALYLGKLAKNVKMIMKAKNYAPREKIQYSRMKNSGIETIPLTEVIEIYGDELVRGIKIRNLKNGELGEIETDGVFVEIGKTPNTDFLKNLPIKMDSAGYVITNDRQETNIPGIFAAGDVTSASVKQLGVAVAQGTVAALQAYAYLNGRG